MHLLPRRLAETENSPDCSDPVVAGAEREGLAEVALGDAIHLALAVVSGVGGDAAGEWMRGVDKVSGRASG